MMVVDRERGNAVDRIRNDRRAGRELGHQHAVRIRRVAELLLDRRDRLGMPFERHAERRRSRLPRVVVGRGADAAEAEQDVAARERMREGTR